MVNAIKRILLFLFVPFQVAAADDCRNAALCPPWVDPADDCGTQSQFENEYEFEEGFDLYGMADDNCSFDLFDDDDAGWNEEDAF